MNKFFLLLISLNSFSINYCSEKEKKSYVENKKKCIQSYEFVLDQLINQIFHKLETSFNELTQDQIKSKILKEIKEFLYNKTKFLNEFTRSDIEETAREKIEDLINWQYISS